MAGDTVDLSLSAEALDVLIDLYSDDGTDDLAISCNLVCKLQQILPSYREHFKREKSQHREDKVLLATVADNLPQFIKYKAARARNISPSKENNKCGTSKAVNSSKKGKKRK